MNDSLFWLLLVLRYMHILGAIALMGGTIFMRFALAPSAAALEDKARQELHEQVRSRWSKFVMLAAALLLVSGVVNMILTPMYYELSGVVDNKRYNMIVGIKFVPTNVIPSVVSLTKLRMLEIRRVNPSVPQRQSQGRSLSSR